MPTRIMLDGPPVFGTGRELRAWIAEVRKLEPTEEVLQELKLAEELLAKMAAG